MYIRDMFPFSLQFFFLDYMNKYNYDVKFMADII